LGHNHREHAVAAGQHELRSEQDDRLRVALAVLDRASSAILAKGPSNSRRMESNIKGTDDRIAG
jgi:hypothetical protein